MSGKLAKEHTPHMSMVRILGWRLRSTVIILGVVACLMGLKVIPATPSALSAKKSSIGLTEQKSVDISVGTMTLPAQSQRVGPHASTMNGTLDRSTPKLTACASLTPQIAQRIIGYPAELDTQVNASDLKTGDTEVTSCAYSHGVGTTVTRVQLTVHKALTALGASENGVVFGSARPAGAISVQGYGQVAYWDPTAGSLNVLARNNWYLLSRSYGISLAPVNLTDTEAAASMLVVESK